MILENKEKMICHNNKNENLPIVEEVDIGKPKYMANRREIYEHVGHHNICIDLVEHNFNTHLNHDALYVSNYIVSYVYIGDIKPL